MIKLSTFLRRYRRNFKFYSITTLGICASFVLAFCALSFSVKEYSVNRLGFSSKMENVYKVLTSSPEEKALNEESFYPIGNILAEQSPFVNDYTTFTLNSDTRIFIEGEPIETKLATIKPNFFEFFEFPIWAGSARKMESTPNAVIITKSFADTYFTNSEAIGQFIEIPKPRSRNEFIPLEVVAVAEDLPDNTTLSGDVFINSIDWLSLFMSPDATEEYREMFLWNISCQTYLELIPNHQKELSENNLNQLLDEKLMLVFEDNSADFKLQKFNQIYLHSKEVAVRSYEKGDTSLVRLFLIIGIVVLLMAMLNYILIELGLFTKQAKDYQTRMCFGASKKLILNSFVKEAFFNLGLCFILAVGIFALLTPYVSAYFGYDLGFSPYMIKALPLVAVGFLIMVGLSSFSRYVLLKRHLKYSITPISIRNKNFGSGLILFQLVMFIGIVTTLSGVFKQVNYLTSFDPGFDLENTIVVSSQPGLDVLINEFAQKAYVNDYSTGQSLFVSRKFESEYAIAGTEQKVKAKFNKADHKYLDTYEIDLVEGRNMNPKLIPNLADYSTSKFDPDKMLELLVNEEFVKEAGLQEPVGTVIQNRQMRGTIVGVIKNVNNTSLHDKITPLVMGYFTLGTISLILNIDKDELPKFQADFAKICEERDLLAYMDQMYAVYDKKEIYASEYQVRKLMSVMSVLALIISGLGLFAMSLFVSESKVKEIGIRKIIGASLYDILKIINYRFGLSVIIAFVIASPIAYLLINRWLEGFAYNTTLSGWAFLGIGLTTFLLVLLIVSLQSWKVVNKNPIESLRYE
ncbi:MAG: ABC transporter permease [Bacteroidota bacterium]